MSTLTQFQIAAALAIPPPEVLALAKNISFPRPTSVGGVLMWDSAAFATFQALWVAALGRGWRPTAACPFSRPSTFRRLRWRRPVLRIGLKATAIRRCSISDGRRYAPRRREDSGHGETSPARSIGQSSRCGSPRWATHLSAGDPLGPTGFHSRARRWASAI
jgi:hypothetical protein